MKWEVAQYFTHGLFGEPKPRPVNCELSGLYTGAHAFWIWINRVHSVFVVQVNNNWRQDRDSQKGRDRGQGRGYNRKSAKFNQSGTVYFLRSLSLIVYLELPSAEKVQRYFSIWMVAIPGEKCGRSQRFNSLIVYLELPSAEKVQRYFSIWWWLRRTRSAEEAEGIHKCWSLLRSYVIVNLE